MLLPRRTALLAEASARIMFAASVANAKALSRAGQARADEQFADLMDRTGITVTAPLRAERPRRWRLEVKDPQILAERRSLAAAQAW